MDFSMIFIRISAELLARLLVHLRNRKSSAATRGVRGAPRHPRQWFSLSSGAALRSDAAVCRVVGRWPSW